MRCRYTNNLVVEKYLVYIFNMISKNEMKTRENLLETIPRDEQFQLKLKFQLLKNNS